MNKLLFIAFFCVTFNCFSQTIFGKWKTVDINSGEDKSIVEIYERDGKVFGKILDILDREDKNILCNKCKGEAKGKPVIGFELLKNLEKQGKYYKNGTIFHPEKGKQYNCRITLTEDVNKLEVRGYIGFFYENHYWHRVLNE